MKLNCCALERENEAYRENGEEAFIEVCKFLYQQKNI